MGVLVIQPQIFSSCGARYCLPTLIARQEEQEKVGEQAVKRGMGLQ